QQAGARPRLRRAPDRLRVIPTTSRSKEDLAMLTAKAPRFWLAALAGGLGIPAPPVPPPAHDGTALKEQIRILKQRIDELNQQVDELARKQQQQAAAAAAAAQPAGPPAEPKFEAYAKEQKDKGGEPKLAAFLKGFYGTLDVSFDD